MSAPTRVASKTKLPVPLMVPPVTSSPSDFSAGAGSPVSIASSTNDAPDTTRPSTGTRSPGRTRTRSPIWTSATARSISPAAVTTRAVCGWSPTSARIAAPVWPLALASKYLPSSTSVMTTAAAS